MLVTIAAFLVFLGVLLTMVASREAKKDSLGRKIPPERAQIAALFLLVIGVGLFAYTLYLKAYG